MDNHYHVLFETPDANLSTAMRDLNGNYAQSFNTRHGRAGHLFQGRYKAFVIEKDAYLLGVARYTVLNPVRACLVSHPREWKWSSYRATSGEITAPTWLTTDWILGNFSKNRSSAKRQYRQFVLNGTDMKDPFNYVEHDFILGTPQFVHWIWDHYTTESETIEDYPRSQRMVGRPTLDEIFANGMTQQERDDAIVFARMRCSYLNTEIARHLGLNKSTVGKIVRGTYNRT